MTNRWSMDKIEASRLCFCSNVVRVRPLLVVVGPKRAYNAQSLSKCSRFTNDLAPPFASNIISGSSSSSFFSVDPNFFFFFPISSSSNSWASFSISCFLCFFFAKTSAEVNAAAAGAELIRTSRKLFPPPVTFCLLALSTAA